MISTILERQIFGGVATADNFVVNTAALKSAVVAGSSLTLYDKSNNQKSWFSQNDGVLVQSMYVRLPYQFTMADAPWFLELYAELADGSLYTFGTIGESGSEGVPVVMENYEIPVNAYLAPPPAAISASQKWKLRGCVSVTYAGTAPAVSMINAPAALNGATLAMIVGARIVHAFPLTAAS